MMNIHKRNQVEFETEKVNDYLSKKASPTKPDFPNFEKDKVLGVLK